MHDILLTPSFSIFVGMQYCGIPYPIIPLPLSLLMDLGMLLVLGKLQLLPPLMNM